MREPPVSTARNGGDSEKKSTGEDKFDKKGCMGVWDGRRGDGGAREGGWEPGTGAPRCFMVLIASGGPGEADAVRAVPGVSGV